MKTSDLAIIAQKAGELLLKSGAEIYRVEETINMICKAYGATSNSFALPSGIFFSVTDNASETVTLILRVKKREVNFSKIAMVNDFSRKVLQNRVSLAEALQTLSKIENTKSYPFMIRLLASGIVATVFCIMFGGKLFESGVSFIAGILIFLTVKGISKISRYQFLEYFCAGLVAGLVCLFASFIFKEVNIYSIIIGSVMMQLPGVSITNGIRDALHGDIVSSVARLLESALWVTAIGVGVALVISFK